MRVSKVRGAADQKQQAAENVCAVCGAREKAVVEALVNVDRCFK
jgi:hypothetical protein